MPSFLFGKFNGFQGAVIEGMEVGACIGFAGGIAQAVDRAVEVAQSL